MKTKLIKKEMFTILPRWRIIKETGILTGKVDFYIEIMRKTWFFNSWERMYNSYYMEYVHYETYKEAEKAIYEYAELHEKGYFKYQLIKYYYD